MNEEPSSCRILIVDISVRMQRVMTHLLELYGFELLTASTPDDAVRSSTEYQPHAVYVGLTCEDCDCWGLPHRLRQVDGLNSTMFVGLVAPDHKSQQKSWMHKEEFDFFFSRPPTMSEIVEKLTASYL